MSRAFLGRRSWVVWRRFLTPYTRAPSTTLLRSARRSLRQQLHRLVLLASCHLQPTAEITHMRRLFANRLAMILALPSMRYPLRSLVRLPLYFGGHFHPIRTIPFSTRRSPTWATFADYVETVPMWEWNLLAHDAMEKPLATPLYLLFPIKGCYPPGRQRW
jgi:hypothetical protein